MTAFDKAWALLKAPWIDGGSHHALSGKPVTIDGPLYSGGDKLDDPRYWTDDVSEALAYAMFGPRNDYEGTPFVDANEHYPELYRVDAPKEDVELPPDEEYMSDERGAIERGRVAFHDQEGILDAYNPQKLPDEHVAQIIENIINSDLYDDEMDSFEEETFDADEYDLEPNERWDQIFNLPKGGRMGEWESLYPQTRFDSPESTGIYEALEEKYDEEPLWDNITTNQILTNNSKPHDFVRRLRERGL